MGNMTEFEGKKFVPVTAADLDLGELEDKTPEKKEEQAKAAQPLVERFKKALGDKVTDVRVSDRLVESPSCVTAEHGQILTVQMRRMLEATGQQGRVHLRRSAALRAGVPQRSQQLRAAPERAAARLTGLTAGPGAPPSARPCLPRESRADVPGFLSSSK